VKKNTIMIIAYLSVPVILIFGAFLFIAIKAGSLDKAAESRARCVSLNGHLGGGKCFINGEEK